MTLLARQNPRFDDERLRRLSGEQLELWRAIGTGTSVQALLDQSGSKRTLDLLRTLKALGAIELADGSGSRATPQHEAASVADDDIPIHVAPEHIPPVQDAVEDTETRMMSEDVDLEPTQKRRILSILRAVEVGDYFNILELPKGASTRQLKRAYYALSKECHPDRFFGRRLGSFGPVLERVFAATSQFVRTLSDTRTVTREMDRPGAPKRRQSARFPLAVRVQLTSASRPQADALTTVDLSDGGVFIAANGSVPAVGEQVELHFETPSAALRLQGDVVASRPPDEASRIGRRAGIGVRFAISSEDDRGKIHQLLALAKQMAPAPEGVEKDDGPRRRIARGTAPVPRPDPIIGIDLGTTHTGVSAMVGNRIRMLQWPGGLRSIPSVVAFPEPGKIVVGAEARKRLVRDPKHVIASSKRLLGRAPDDRDLASVLGHSGFDTETGPDGNVIINMWGESYAIPQICSYLLSACKRVSQAHLKRPVERAVLTVPASFTRQRVDLLRRAARLSHLDVVDIIEEPSSAALANRFDPAFGGLVGVYDFGGGTFDFSVVDASAGELNVLTTTGDSWLGGDDFDLAVAEAAANIFWRAHGIDLRQRLVEWQYLLFSCERAKCQLSQDDNATIVVPEAMRTAQGVFDMRIRLNRKSVEPLWAPAIKRSMDTCAQALALLGLKPTDLSAIYLSGGTSYIPAIRQQLARRFQVPIRLGVSPEHAVCLGAGLHAAELERLLPTSIEGIR